MDGSEEFLVNPVLYKVGFSYCRSITHAITSGLRLRIWLQKTESSLFCQQTRRMSFVEKNSECRIQGPPIPPADSCYEGGRVYEV